MEGLGGGCRPGQLWPLTPLVLTCLVGTHHFWHTVLHSLTQSYTLLKHLLCVKNFAESVVMYSQPHAGTSHTHILILSQLVLCLLFPWAISLQSISLGIGGERKRDISEQ